MERKTIFEILNAEINYTVEFKRLRQLFQIEKIDSYGSTLASFIDKYIFRKWEHRGTCININECFCMIYNPLNIENIDITTLLNYIEFITNILLFTIKQYSDINNYKNLINSKIHIIFTNIRNLLDKIGYNISEEDEYGRVFIYENSREATLAAELSPEISSYILKYKSYNLTENIEEKKQILKVLGDYIEPLRKQIKNDCIESDLFFALNNLNIRHNNMNTKDKSHFVKFLQNFTDKDFIKYYDKTYNLIILAICMINYKEEIEPELKALKQSLK